MKKIFISIVCAVFLTIGSLAAADPMPLTSSIKFYGAGLYLGGDDAPFGPFGEYGPIYAIGILHYEKEVADLDWNTTYAFTLDYSIRTKGIFKAEGEFKKFDITETGEDIRLGTFSLNDGYDHRLLDADNHIGSLLSPGNPYGISSMHFGDGDEGTLLLGLSEPIDGLQGAIAGIKGEVRINANAVAPVPEPATMLLFGTGLAGLAGFSFKRKKK
jgi:hypothetical protein